MTAPASVAPALTPVEDPVDLTWTDYKAAVKATVEEFRDDDVVSLAAGVAFRIFLSLFPALVAVVALFSLFTTPDELRDMLAGVQGDLLPTDAVAVIDTPLEELAAQDTNASLAALLGVVGGLWAATSAAGALMKALSRAYEVDERRGFLKRRLVALVLTFALFAALIGLVLLLVAGEQLQRFLLPDVVERTAVGAAVTAARLVGALLLLVVLFAFTYWIGPSRERPPWVWISPGAVVGVFGWLALSGAFTLYVRTAGNFRATYGTLAGVILLLLWLQLSMLVLILGGELNAELERVREHKRSVRLGAGFAHASPGVAAAVPVPASAPLLPAPPEIGRRPRVRPRLVPPVLGVVAPVAVLGALLALLVRLARSIAR